MKDRLHALVKKLDVAAGLKKIYRFCAYQERSHLEVRSKLYSLGLYEDEVNEILARLIVEGFLNEERFAKAFAGGKFRIKKWGRNKIIHALQAKGLTGNCIQHGLADIATPDYHKSLREVIRKKAEKTTSPDPFQKRAKVARFVISKGYEPDLVWEFVREIILD